MFNSIYLDIAIGMVFIFLLYSLFTTAIQEVLATWLSLRGKQLKKSIEVLLADKNLDGGLAKDFYNHPLIKRSVFKRFDHIPSYIAPDVFSRVLQDILPDKYTGEEQPLSVKERIALLPEGDLKKILEMMGKGGLSLDQDIQHWFNTSMERLSGAYKRSSQNRVLVIGFIMAVLFNVNAITVFQRLGSDEQARNELVRQASAFMEKSISYDSMVNVYRSRVQPVDTTAGTVVAGTGTAGAKDSERQKLAAEDTAVLNEFKRQRDEIKKLIDGDISKANDALGIGWDLEKEGDTIGSVLFGKGTGSFLLHLLGWFITALAITIGAPFWFDLLQKMMRLRGAGARPATEDKAGK